MDSFPPGQTIERYAVERILGEGGHATVYQVRHADLGVVRALKVLHTSDTTLRSRLLTEGRILATLHHPNLVAVFDVLRVENAPALVMEFVGGGSIEELLGRVPISIVEVDRLFREICAGVAAAHAAGVVHRDLKPANILMDDSVSPPRPKVADFGIARVDDDDDKGHRTRTQQGMGSPAYMAPEQARAAAAADTRADIWSLGACLYAMLAGSPPFKGPAVWEVMAAAAAGRYIPVEQIRPETPPGMVAVVSACLRPIAQERPPDIAAVLAILDGRGSHPLLSGSAGETQEWPAVAALAEAVRVDAEPVSRADSEIAPIKVPFSPVPLDVAVNTPAPASGRPGVANALVLDVAGRGHVVEVIVEVREGEGSVWTPTDVARDTQVAAQAAAAAALGANLARSNVTWQVRGVGFRIEGTSLGLAIAIACVSSTRGVPVPPGWAFTGGVDIDGRLVPVAGVPAKLLAASMAGITHAAVPAGPPLEAPAGLVPVVAPRLAALIPQVFRRTQRERFVGWLPLGLALLLGPAAGLTQAGAIVDSGLQYPVLRFAGRSVEVTDVVVVDLPVVDDLRSLRATYASLFERLSAAGVKAAILDLTLTAETEHDEALAQAISSVRAAGLSVIVPIRVDGETVALPANQALAGSLVLGHAISQRDLSVGWVRRARVDIRDLEGRAWWHVSILAATASVGAANPQTEGGWLATGPLRNAVSMGSFAVAPAGEVPHIEASGNFAGLADKIAVVGIIREGTDLHATGDGTRYGAEVLAVEVQTLLRQAAPRQVTPEVDALAAGIAAVVSGMASHKHRWLPAAVASLLGIGTLILAASGILMSVVAPLVAVATVAAVRFFVARTNRA